MGITGFISGKLRFRGKIVVISIALSFLVMIIAVSVSSGFRKEIRDAVSSATGDIRLVPTGLDWISGTSPIERTPAYLPYVASVDGVKSVSPVVYRAGIVKNDASFHGVLFKGTEDFMPEDSTALPVSVPSRLADMLELEEGSPLSAYFVGERVRARKFTVVSVYEDLTETDDRMVVYGRLSDMQRINGWSDDYVSAFEIRLEDRFRDEAGMEALAAETGSAALLHSSEDEASVVSMSAAEENPRLFDWLSLIDFNVLVILILMTMVAGFNMISGLLILLFRNISTIGTLKSLGMTDRSIAGVFLRVSARLAGIGMLAGNAAALLFCLVQGSTKIIRLNPENYFVSFVPVDVNLPMILLADAAAVAVIMLLLLIPSRFIAKGDPSVTVKTE